MTVYSDRDFNHDRLLDTEIEETPAVDIERPVGEVSVQPSSVDLHLDSDVLVMGDQDLPVYVDEENTYPDYHEYCDQDTIPIQPHEFVLATTEETVSLDDSVVGYLDGRSSVGRLGLFVENAGLIDAGFGPGELTLELFNVSPNTIMLKSGMRIAQMTIHELRQESSIGYDDKDDEKYSRQRGVTPSRLWEDFDGEGSWKEKYGFRHSEDFELE